MDAEARWSSSRLEVGLGSRAIRRIGVGDAMVQATAMTRAWASLFSSSLYFSDFFSISVSFSVFQFVSFFRFNSTHFFFPVRFLFESVFSFSFSFRVATWQGHGLMGLTAKAWLSGKGRGEAVRD